jgi:hypothetical protein
MREIFAGVPTVWQRCASPINSCQSGADKQFVQVTAAWGYDDCIVASWSKNFPPTCVDREWLCKSACREYSFCAVVLQSRGWWRKRSRLRHRIKDELAA